MQVTLASRASVGGGANEDFGIATGHIVVMLDGSPVPEGHEIGCSHGTAWFVRRLGMALLDSLDSQAKLTLRDNLAQAIVNVNALHMYTCNLFRPTNPSAGVAILCSRTDNVEFLLLGDVAIVLDEPGGIRTITSGPLESKASAGQVSTSPGVVDSAVTGVARGLRRAALLSGGAARIVTTFQLLDWSGLLDLLDGPGPERAIDLVRDAERSDPAGSRWPRSPVHDDATIIVCRFRSSQSAVST